MLGMIDEILQKTDGCFLHPVPDGGRRIAWDAVSFCVPSNWELAAYTFRRRNVSHIELEDEYAIRTEAEWIRGRQNMNLHEIMKRYEKASKPLTVKSDQMHNVVGLPPGWHATHFVFKETGPEANDDLTIMRHDLVTAFYLCPRSSIFCFFLIHFLPDDAESPMDVMRMIATTFQDHGAARAIPWQLFDISFMAPRHFVLLNTQFDIGVKLMVFTWKLRRFFLWHFSCPDIFLQAGKTPAEWACGHLNGERLLKAPVFYPNGRETIRWRRRKPHYFGHREEMATLCYQYDVGCRLLEAEHKLVVWVYHYRKASDLNLYAEC